MRTIIAGSRTIFDYNLLVEAIVDSGFVITELICGGAAGVDSLGYRWAYVNKIPIRMFKPDWNGIDKAAGHVRNFEMAANADQAILLWDGVSPGTKSMIEYAKKCQVHVYLVQVNLDTLVTQGRSASTTPASAPTLPLPLVASRRLILSSRLPLPAHNENLNVS